MKGQARDPEYQVVATDKGDVNENATQTGVLSKTMVLHVCYRFWYIFLPLSDKKIQNMTKFMANVSI